MSLPDLLCLYGTELFYKARFLGASAVFIHPCTGGRTAEHALGFVGLSHMGNVCLTWAVCVTQAVCCTQAVYVPHGQYVPHSVSHGQCVSHRQYVTWAVCLTWALRPTQAGCLTWAVCPTWAMCPTQAVCLTWAVCVSHRRYCPMWAVCPTQAVFHMGSVCPMWAVCPTQTVGFTWSVCVPHTQYVPHMGSWLFVTNQGNAAYRTGGYAVGSGQSVVRRWWSSCGTASVTSGCQMEVMVRCKSIR